MSEFIINKTVDEVKTEVENEIASHNKHNKINEITGNVSQNKLNLSVTRDIPVITGSYFKNYFYADIIDEIDNTKIKGFFSMKPLRLIVLAILLAVCIESIIFTICTNANFSNFLAPVIILVAEVVILILQYYNSKSDREVINNFLSSLNNSDAQKENNIEKTTDTVESNDIPNKIDNDTVDEASNDTVNETDEK